MITLNEHEIKNAFYEKPYLWFYLSHQQFVTEASKNIIKYQECFKELKPYNIKELYSFLNEFHKIQLLEDFGFNGFLQQFVHIYKMLPTNSNDYKINLTKFNIDKNKLKIDYFFFLVRLRLRNYNYRFIHNKQEIISMFERVFFQNITSLDMLNYLTTLPYFKFITNLPGIKGFVGIEKQSIYPEFYITELLQILTDQFFHFAPLYHKLKINDRYFDSTVDLNVWTYKKVNEHNDQVSKGIKLTVHTIYDIMSAFLNTIHYCALVDFGFLKNIYHHLLIYFYNNDPIRSPLEISIDRHNVLNKHYKLSFFNRNELLYKVLCQEELSDELQTKLSSLTMDFTEHVSSEFFREYSFDLIPLMLLNHFINKSKELDKNNYILRLEEIKSTISRIELLLLNNDLKKNERNIYEDQKVYWYQQHDVVKELNEYRNKEIAYHKNNLLAGLFDVLRNLNQPLVEFTPFLYIEKKKPIPVADINLVLEIIIKKLLKYNYIEFPSSTQWNDRLIKKRNRIYNYITDLIKICPPIGSKRYSDDERYLATLLLRLEEINNTHQTPSDILKGNEYLLNDLEKGLENLYNNKDFLGTTIYYEKKWLFKLKKKNISGDYLCTIKALLFYSSLNKDKNLKLETIKQNPDKAFHYLISRLHEFLQKNRSFYEGEDIKVFKELLYFCYVQIYSFSLHYLKECHFSYEQHKIILEKKKIQEKSDCSYRELKYIGLNLYKMVTLKYFNYPNAYYPFFRRELQGYSTKNYDLSPHLEYLKVNSIFDFTEVCFRLKTYSDILFNFNYENKDQRLKELYKYLCMTCFYFKQWRGKYSFLTFKEANDHILQIAKYAEMEYNEKYVNEIEAAKRIFKFLKDINIMEIKLPLLNHEAFTHANTLAFIWSNAFQLVYEYNIISDQVNLIGWDSSVNPTMCELITLNLEAISKIYIQYFNEDLADNLKIQIEEFQNKAKSPDIYRSFLEQENSESIVEYFTKIATYNIENLQKNKLK